MTGTEWTSLDAPKHVLAIVNPASGSKRGTIVIERLRTIREPQITLHATTPEFDYAGIIRAGVENGADRILLAGGDGTLMQGVSGAQHALGKTLSVPFSWVPVGTGNVVSGFLGLPHRLDPAIKLALGPGSLRRIDLAKVGDRCSVLRVSTGFEAEAARVTREDKDRLGLLAYAIPGIKYLRQTRPVEYLISLDGQSPIRVEGIMAFVTATGALTWINGLSVINEAIQPDDGLLYAGVLRPLNPGRVLNSVTNLVAGSGLPPESIIYFSARKRIVIDSKTPQQTQIDGDPLGTTPIIADLLPRALPIVVSAERQRASSYLEWLSRESAADND